MLKPKKNIHATRALAAALSLRAAGRYGLAAALKNAAWQGCALFSLIVAALCLTSCASECNMAGRTTIPGLDGQTLHLTAFFDDNGTRPGDTCRIVHGNFSFYCDVDTMYIASICVGSERLLPVVVESGNIQINVDNIGPNVKGGPMNDRLYKFRNKMNKLNNKYTELREKCIQLMHDGTTYEEACQKYGDKIQKIEGEIAELEDKFIIENSDNVLGTSFFRMKYGSYPIPVVTDEINNILKSASKEFLRDPYVSWYLNIAVRNPMSRPCKLSK